ncbi:MAG: hypothetical protein HY665_01160 [Chloroflexi bacterium]|nr:hypothetical protein [Chloroflexota bacterium]
MPGETIDILLSFTNNGSEAGIISPFPLEIFMPALEGTYKEKIVFSFVGSGETLTLGPGETKTYAYKWNQMKSDGSQAAPGLYKLRAFPSGAKVGYDMLIGLASVQFEGFLIQNSQ